MTANPQNEDRSKSKSVFKRLSITLLVLIVFTPLGIILPAKLGAGSAWGEWSVDQVHKMVGYKPAGMTQFAHKWNAPLPDYGFKGDENPLLQKQSISYVLSALVGVLCIGGVSLIIGRMASRSDQSENS